MPAKYEAIKKSYQQAGKSNLIAEKLAAMTYNSQRKPGQVPMGPNYEQRARKARK
jgi:hypothetical protein